ncbi:uncharacterized protein SAPINGB_P004156 [Magnusiomyces paraingens]|uniref:Lysophospholipase n=1 Tax=Magnusiomyces paraingens TaxID=2606893 RepID=A0A5E8BVF1_9ASCO|nr:uncharacterized protein SAPINGB_P004156 [Saprochaete ingens]VVT54599.1 unnamed protein product [Saprochaete ingens]
MHLSPAALLAAAAVLVTMPQQVSAWNPGNSYAPSYVDCPDSVDNFLRSASSLSDQEEEWITERKKQTDEALKTFLARINMTDIDTDSFLGTNTSLTIGLAFSGGGYRAMLTGAGEFAALDSRTPNSTNTGHLGGLVQSATYLSGLSGGSWLVGSIVLNNFSTIDNLQYNDNLWNLEHSIFNPGGINVFSTASYFDKLADDVDDKRDAGFNTSLTDIWGRALSQQFIDLDRGGPAMTWNDIQNFPVFLNHSMPFPLVVATGRAPNTKIISTNSTVFEFSPFELGSWDPSLHKFTNLTWLGSNVTNGKPNNGTCVLGFDQAGFTMGTSSSLFNQFILQINSTGISGILRKLAESILSDLSEDYNDIAVYAPNPFTDSGNNAISNSDFLALVDGGEDNQNVPFYPLIQPQRELDVIFAYDNSADTDYSWPNGASIQATYTRQFGTQNNGSFFPSVPDNNTFINDQLTRKPTFFGCYASNFTTLRSQTNSSSSIIPPVIVYTSNAYYTYLSNTSTFKMKYSDDEKNSIIENNYAVATYGNGTIDSEFTACIGCAIIQREVERRGIEQTEQCKRCFNKYCWDGATNSSKPSAATIADINEQSVLEAAGVVSLASQPSSSASASSASASATASSTSSKSGASTLTHYSPMAFVALCFVAGLML